MEKSFNLRAYGLLINENGEILIVREIVKNRMITKFPGGGLEFGEGLVDCLVREFKEELGIEIEVLSHFYTTDYFVESFFNPHHQVIAVYYLVKTKDAVNSRYEKYFKEVIEDGELDFIWVPVEKLDSGLLSLPIDKHVGELLRKTIKHNT